MESISYDVWQISNLDITIRIFLAAALGGMIGLEREWHNHAAGFRTHMLVCIGSATIMLLSIHGFAQFADQPSVRLDPARLAAQVISGIGFLGAGAIMRHGLTVTGLTTAASIWVVAAIGLSVGAGFYYPAALATILVIISLFFLHKWERRVMRFRRKYELSVKIFDRPGLLSKISEVLDKHRIRINNLNMQTETRDEDNGIAGVGIMELKLSLRVSKAQSFLQALDEITGLEYVISVESDSPIHLARARAR